MRSIVFVLVGLGGLTAAPPTPSGAQQVPEEMVPREFVEALIQPLPYAGRRPVPELRVGALPEDLGLVPPDGSRVIGSVLYPSYSNSAVGFDGTEMEATREWIGALERSGWTRHEPPVRSGFAQTPAAGLDFCDDGHGTISLGTAERQDGGTLVWIRHSRGQRYSVCDTTRPMMGRERMAESPIPALAPPEASRSRGGGSGGGGGEWHADARLWTELSASDLLDHYASQLSDLGWEMRGIARGEGIAAATFLVIQDDDEWHAELSVSKPDDEVALPWLRLTRVDEGR